MILLCFDETGVDMDVLCLVCTIDACHIPCLATSACHHSIFTRETSHKASLIPCGWKVAEEILHLLRLSQETLWAGCQVLEGRFKEHGESQLMSMRGDMWMLRVGESTWSVVHRSYHIAGERKRGIVGCGFLGEGRHIVIPLCTIHAFSGEEMGICALPATWDGSTVEIDQQMMACRTLKKVKAIIHVHLVVAREEVNLHACHTNLLAPRKFLLTVFWLVQAELRARSTVDPAYRRVVPDEWLHPLRLGIIDSIYHCLAIFHLVPFSINQHVWQLECLGKINILLDDVIVVRTMIVGPIDPGDHTRMYPSSVCQFAGFRHVGNKSGLHHSSQRTDNSHTPRCVPVAIEFHLILIRHQSVMFGITIIVE